MWGVYKGKMSSRKFARSPDEQLKLERTRFNAKQKRIENLQEEKRLELMRMGEGNKCLFDYDIKED